MTKSSEKDDASAREPFVPFKVQWGKTAPAPAGEVEMPREDRLFNRDLSWLAFNERVLNEAADSGVPPLERLRMATIVSSNLDEFFMVRVAELSRTARREPGARFPDGLTVRQALAQIRERVLGQKSRQAAVLDDILAALRAKGIEILTDFAEDAALDAEIAAALPRLRICRRKSSESFPDLRSARIHVFVRFPGEYAFISIEEREARLLELPPAKSGRRYVLLERWLSARAAQLFGGREVIEAFPFKLIRDADLRYRPDEEDTLEEQIRQAVEGRQRARIVRLEVDSPSYSEGALFLASALGLDSGGLYRFDLPLDLRTLAMVYSQEGSERLRYPPVQPQTPALFAKAKTLFDAIRRRDILLHHPYDSFDIVESFVKAAAEDPDVTAIRHTLYRTSRESPIIEALREAARRGKKVTAYVEIKARFDELNNVRCAEELRQSGVRIIRPLGRFKVHSKITQVLRKEGESEASYLHLGTGNYHPVTARQYTDLGLLTCDATLGAEAAEYFLAMARGAEPAGMKELLVAPGSLHRQVRRLIRGEVEHHKKDGNGRIMAKMNSLADIETIEELYGASRAGVKVDLLVRGICALVPGIKGLSENIRVVSVIDRFLEHSRIFYFRAGGAERLYLSSADWMPRNFFTRYEIAFPVKDAALKVYVRDVILGRGLEDNVKAWTLRPDGAYVKPAAEAEAVRSQELFEALARKGYRDTALEKR